MFSSIQPLLKQLLVFGIAGFVCLPLLSTGPVAKPGKKLLIEAREISVFRPEKPDRVRFGKLEFLGGLELASASKDFGGISGLRFIGNSNEFLAVTDKGFWLSAELIRDRNRPAAIEAARITRLRDSSGKKLNKKSEADAEGLEISGDVVFISFERQHRIEQYSLLNGEIIPAAKGPVVVFEPNEFSKNSGLEAVAKPDGESPLAGTLLAFPEHAPSQDGNLRGFIIDENSAAEFRIAKSKNFSITDADFLPNGDLVLLERKFSIAEGVALRIRRFDSVAIMPGALVDGEILIEADWSYEIDNMEALAISDMPGGDSRLTLVSDDNFSRNQRTLLLEFRLPAD